MAGQRIMRGLTAAFLAIVLGLTIGGLADLLISASAGDEAGRQAGGLGFIAGVVAAIWFTFKSGGFLRGSRPSLRSRLSSGERRSLTGSAIRNRPGNTGRTEPLPLARTLGYGRGSFRVRGLRR